MGGLLRSPNWLLVGGEAVSEPDEGRVVDLEVGDLGSGDLGSSNEKKRDSVLEFCWPGEAALGRPSVSLGWLGRGPLCRGPLCRGSLGGSSPVA